LGYGKEGTVEYTVMTRMPGAAVKYSELTAGERETMLFELGIMLVQIHSADIQPFYDSGLFPDIDRNTEDIKERLKYQFDRTLGRISGKMTQAEIDEANASSAELLGKLQNESVRIVPCHANPGPEHTFVKDGKLSGVIDFGDAYISHPIFDMRRWPVADRKHVIDGYMSAAKIDDSFAKICGVSNALDTILEELNAKFR
jgi:Ser/Thr protein kinase RdoA (MazF antagonist)